MTEYMFTEQELNELRELFFSEAYEILQTIDQEVLNIESGQDRESAFKTIQRSFHTLKGNSRALGFSCLNTLTHKSEDLLKTIDDAGPVVNKEITDLLFAINDSLRIAMDGYRSNSEVSLDSTIMERIEHHLTTEAHNGKIEKIITAKPDKKTASCLYDIRIIFDPACREKVASAELLLNKLATLGEIISTNPLPGSQDVAHADDFAVRVTTSQNSAQIKDVLQRAGINSSIEIRNEGQIKQQDAQKESKCPAIKDETAQTLRVDSLRIDKILNLIGELVIGRSMIGQVIAELGDRYKRDELVKKLGDTNVFMEKTLSGLQKQVMKIRMLPIVQVFRKFPRVVRDLSLEKNKLIELVMAGEKTELDKSILDAIGDPLIHLVRNAIDHGIELPEQRERSGKPRIGKITLSAFHEANQIVISVSDDGTGIDTDRLRTKAVENGIMSREEAERLSDEEASDLIFLTGLSTAHEVTDISGRGVGMDIVRSTVESLKGRIEVRSQHGQGTTFTMRLPLTLAIIRAMLFWVGNRLFALPMASIEKIIRVKDSDIQTITGKQILRFRNSMISLVAVNEPLKIRDAQFNDAKNAFIIIVKIENTPYGLLVDRLAGQQELVIKSLDDHWSTINCTSGASILGSGKVVLILDAPALVAKEKQRVTDFK